MRRTCTLWGGEGRVWWSFHTFVHSRFRGARAFVWLVGEKMTSASRVWVPGDGGGSVACVGTRGARGLCERCVFTPSFTPRGVVVILGRLAGVHGGVRWAQLGVFGVLARNLGCMVCSGVGGV